MFSEVSPLITMLHLLRDRARTTFAEENRSRGASAIEWAMITAVAAIICIAVGATLYNMITSKASSISTNTPVGN
jgi:Flp pilus assembly pilin Flp